VDSAKGGSDGIDGIRAIVDNKGIDKMNKCQDCEPEET
jgi:hypothetical protein